MGDIDITLRHISRRRPADLARPFVPAHRRIQVLGWVDSQVTKIERRADKAMRLLVAREPRVLHVEFYLSLHKGVPDAMFEYLGFPFTALRAEADGEPVPPIDSVAVILTGPSNPLPAFGKRCTAWPGRKFSGTHFRIDAVYQRTLAELRARGSVLWLVFAPLARDATPAAMRDVVAEIRAGAVDDQERDELLIALFVMAYVDAWGHNLLEEIKMVVTEQELHERLKRMPVLGPMIVEAEEKGREEAIADLLGRLFARRVGRRPTTDEERSLTKHTQTLGAEAVEDALLDLDRDALLRWLAKPAAR